MLWVCCIGRPFMRSHGIITRFRSVSAAATAAEMLVVIADQLHVSFFTLPCAAPTGVGRGSACFPCIHLCWPQPCQLLCCIVIDLALDLTLNVSTCILNSVGILDMITWHEDHVQSVFCCKTEQERSSGTKP